MKRTTYSRVVRRLLGSSCVSLAFALSAEAHAQAEQSANTVSQPAEIKQAGQPANTVNQATEIKQSEQQPTSQPPKTGNEAANEGAIVVTGSRIQKTGYSQPTPVTVQTSEALLSSAPVSLAEGLNKLPQFLGSRTRTFCCEVGSQGNFLNLRGLGSNRTLVLLDSHRVVPTRETGDVDVNLLPELLIQRIDVVTGGASAAYGSDAVSGVVNYVIDNRFTGVKGTLQGGISTYGDDQTFKAGIAVGTKFSDDRGHFVLSVEHLNQDGIRSLQDRPTSNRGAFLGGNGTAAAPFITLSGVIQATAAYGGVIIGPSSLPIPGAGAPLAGTQFLPGGQPAPFVFGTPVNGSPGFYFGGDGIVNNLASPAEALSTDHLYGRLSYDVTDNVTAWVRINAGRSRTHGPVLADNRQTSVAYTIFRENPYLPASVATAMDTAGVTSFRLARFNRDFGPINLDYVNKSYDVAFGLNGSIGTNWKWDASYSQGETTLNARVENVGNLSHEYAQADAVVDPATHNIVCRVTLTNPGVYPGCVPINLFGEGSPSDAAKAYALGTSTQFVKNKLQVVDAEVQGNLFDLPAGSVSVAAGGEYRHRSLREESNDIALNQIQAVGIRGFPTALCPTVALCRFGGWNQGNFGEADASDNVKEGFVETIVPVLRDTPFFHALDINGAYRYTDYKNSGAVSTWKLGVSWSPVEDLRIRGTRSRDIRAPNLFELFAGPVNAFQPGLTDQLTHTTNIIAITRTQGNPNLKPEKADTWTIGAIYTPRWLPGFSGSIDYYDIDIKGALSQTTSQGTLDACFQGDQGACSRITRDANLTIQQIVLQQINLNSRLARGIDFDLSYNTHVLNGTLGARALINHAIDYIDDVGGVKTQQAGFYNTANQLTVPKWRGNFNVTYDQGPFSAFVQERYIGSYTQMPPIPGQIFADPKIGSVFYTDVTLKAKVHAYDHDAEFFFTVTDLFNRKPPFIGNRFAAGLGFPTAPGLYDLDNRYFMTGVRLAL